MNKRIDFKKTLFELSKEDLGIIEIMKELGFEDISKPGMLNMAGRIMTIPKGARMKGIDLELIKSTFEAKGYEIIE